VGSAYEGTSLARSNGRVGGAAAPNLTAWSPGEEMDVGTWVRVGHRLGAMDRCSRWLVGDWIRYGTARWGEKYKEISQITGYDVKTLRNIAYVSGQVDMSRRRDNLSWSHHAEVCALDPEQQDQWLDLAASQRMSVADLRIEVRSALRAENAGARPAAKSRLVTCPECDHQFETPR
jgi:hypothetical protein